MVLFVWPATRAIVGEISRGGGKEPRKKGHPCARTRRYEGLGPAHM